MTGLEQTFLIMGIIYMAIMFIIMIVLVAAVLTIKAKIHKLQQQVEEKLMPVLAMMRAGKEMADTVKKVVQKHHS